MINVEYSVYSNIELSNMGYKEKKCIEKGDSKWMNYSTNLNYLMR